MRLYSYVVARDYGFAPNPFHGICTLATCKPVIRRCADIGDWVIGTGSKRYGLDGRLVFAMHVSEILTFDQYWKDGRYESKRPNMRGSKKQAFGDNIYHRHSKTGQWIQENSHHSLADGSANQRNVAHDTGAPRVLVSTTYGYWGGDGPHIPRRFRDFGGEDVCAVRGHKCNFSSRLVSAFADWLGSLNPQGYVSAPMEWVRERRASLLLGLE